MDAFESVAATILEYEGYWVRRGLKVILTKKQKRDLGRPSIPRPEIDLVAYKARSNELLLVECKSYLHSKGVQAADVLGTGNHAKHYKLFTDARLRKLVISCVCEQLTSLKACRHNPTVRLCLIAGKIRNAADAEVLQRHFQQKSWELWTPARIKAALAEIPGKGYENQVAAVVVKLLM